jgi:hypothetical protein
MDRCTSPKAPNPCVPRIVHLLVILIGCHTSKTLKTTHRPPHPYLRHIDSKARQCRNRLVHPKGKMATAFALLNSPLARHDSAEVKRILANELLLPREILFAAQSQSLRLQMAHSQSSCKQYNLHRYTRHTAYISRAFTRRMWEVEGWF